MAYLEQGAPVEVTPLLERSVQELGQIQHRTFQGWVAAFLVKRTASAGSSSKPVSWLSRNYRCSGLLLEI